MLASSVVDRGFEPRSGQTKDYKIGIGCFSAHQRPTFTEILSRLEDIAASPFMTTPQESFQTMQEDWRLEIEAMFDELRSKEKVFADAHILTLF
jgi:hypothetical protein